MFSVEILRGKMLKSLQRVNKNYVPNEIDYKQFILRRNPRILRIKSTAAVFHIILKKKMFIA